MARQAIKIPEPNLIDKAIGFFNPKEALRRHQARVTLAVTGGLGGYSGAKRNRAALSNWQTSAGSPEADISPDLPSLRERSRDLVRNTPIATGALELATSHVIGTGLSPEPTINYEYLGLTEEEAGKWVAQAKHEFNLWAISKDVDIARALNFYQAQALVFRSRMESGDVFVLTPSKDRGNAYSLCLQILEADRISNPNRQNNTDTLIDGIEIEPDTGAPLRCHISSRHPGDLRSKAMSWQAYNFYGSSGRRNVLHICRRLRPGQVRGVPDFAPVIEPLKQLGRYTEAELQAAVTSGMFSIFVKMDAEAFNGLFDDTAQNTIINAGKKWDGNLDNGGKAVNLLPGESIESANPGRPNSEFDPFVQAIIRQIGMALSIPYEVLIMHYESSYSAARAAMLSAWRTWRLARDWMSTDFCQPIYELWLAEAVALGRISAPGFFNDPGVRAAWCSAQWIGDGPGSIDPVKDIEAAERRIAARISTRAAESILHDGTDFETKVKQLAKEQKLMKEAGLEDSPSPQPSAPQPANDAASRMED